MTHCQLYGFWNGGTEGYTDFRQFARVCQQRHFLKNAADIIRKIATFVSTHETWFRVLARASTCYHAEKQICVEVFFS